MGGYIVAVIGVVLIILALVYHFVSNSFIGFAHAAIILGVIGLVLVVAGVAMSRMGRKA